MSTPKSRAGQFEAVMDAMFDEFYPRDDNGDHYLPSPPPFPDLVKLQKAKDDGPWVTPLERWMPPNGHPAMRFGPIAVPPDVQARYDALPEETKARLRAEVDAAVDGLYAQFGITRCKAARDA